MPAAPAPIITTCFLLESAPSSRSGSFSRACILVPDIKYSMVVQMTEFHENFNR